MKWLTCAAIGLVCACGDDSGGGALTLENNPFVTLPIAHASSSGGNVTITTLISTPSGYMDGSEGFEALTSSHSYHAWAGTPGSYTHLGAYDLVSNISGSAPAATDALVTIESTNTPSQPSAMVAVQGSADGDLSFADLSALSFSDGRADVTMDWDWIELAYRGLPSLPAGYHYELWVVTLDDQNKPTGANIKAGVLDSPPDGEMDRYTNANLPTLFELRVTIEADAGVDAISNCVALKLQHDHSQHQH